MRKRTKADWILTVFFGLFGLLVLIPLWYVLVVSLSTPRSYAADPLHLWPRAVSFDQYLSVFRNDSVMRSLMVSAGVTLAGTALSMFLSVCGSYALSKRQLPGRNFFLTLIIITMSSAAALCPITC